MAKKPMREVRIEPVLNGWIVRVGCASVVAMSKEAMLSEIGRYIDDPEAVEKEYAANAVNQGTYQPDGGAVPQSEPSMQEESRPDSGEDCPPANAVPGIAPPLPTGSG